MKIRYFSLTLPAVAGVLALGALTLPDISLAKPDHKSGHSDRGRGNDHGRGRDRGGDRDKNYNRGRDEGAWRHYHSVPRTSFSLHFGSGYAGQGYYYGPANVPYYYQRPEVRYYRTRELAPREYWGNSYRVVSVGASVQSALSRRGYYRGPVDGQVGPYTRRSIARYQADHGLIPTGSINNSLLRSLGL